MRLKAINDTRYEVTFGKAFDKDVAYEIEKEPNRIIAYDGSQNENSSDVLVADTVTFDADNKVATITLNKTPKTDINYTVALMDNKNNTAANIVSKSTPQVLVKGAETPSVDVNSVQDKIVIDFKQKMLEGDDDEVAEAKKASNYTIFDDKGNEVGPLSEYVVEDENAEWVDATTKKAVEFKLAPNTTLEAGKTYKIHVKPAVKTKDGEELVENKRVVDFKTPSINSARPEAKFATVNITGENDSKKNQLELIFDKDLSTEDAVNLARLVKVKTATGTELELGESIEVDGDDVKKLIIPVKAYDEDTEKGHNLDKHTSYTVTLPENVVSNAYFYNALNKSVNVKAEVQDDVAVKSMKAAFERDAKDKTKANLVLSFDQMVTKDLGNFEIRVDGQTYELADEYEEIEYGANGKELKINNVADAFETTGNNPEKLVLENNQSYEIVAGVNAITTNSPNLSQNKEEIKTTISSNIDVTAPKAKRMELVSADEIVVEFDKSIEGTIEAEDVHVGKAFIQNKDGSVDADAVAISDSNHISVSVSGSKVTIKAKDEVKFATGDDQTVKFDAEVFKASNSIENEEVTFTKKEDIDAENSTANYAFVDNAAPEMIGAQAAGKDEIVVTYSEGISTDANNEEFGSQFTFDGLEIKNYGTVAGDISGSKVTFSFTQEDDDGTTEKLDVLKADKNYPNLKIKYAPKTGVEVIDVADNKAKSQTLTGVAKSS